MDEQGSAAGGVAIIGAGMAGLSCARALARAGWRVTLFDKGRTPGGRIATRRTADGLSFDHGAQYATVHGPQFGGLLDEMRAAGAAAPWPAAGRERMVGVPGMSAMPGWMAGRLREAGAVLHQSRYVGFLHRADDGWHVRHLDATETAPGTVVATGGELAGPFEAVVLALPAPQARPLLAAMEHGFAARLDAVATAPCITVMMAFEAPVAGPDIIRPESGPLGWVAREGSRPGREAQPDRWVVQATPAWSRARDTTPDLSASMGELADAFARLLHPAAKPIHARVHRWRFAQTETPLGVASLWDDAARLGVCGDWCLGARIEYAFDSGLDLATRIGRPG
jgi:predicted NAD/FAD-dependent oxidoreductase